MAAKMYSSGEIEYLWLPPIIIWGVKHCVPGQVHSNLLQIDIGCKKAKLDLSIVDEIDGEDEDADATVDEVEELDVDPHQGQDGHQKSKEEKHKEDTEEDAATHCEINLRLKQVSFVIPST